MRGSVLGKVTSIFRDPPPDLAFEICEAGVSMARTRNAGHIRFHELPPGAVAQSPVNDNVGMPEELAAAVAALAPEASMRKRRTAAVILPDYSARISVLEFDSFPDKAEDQQALVRFRLKKSVPFDIETAALSYWRQVDAARKKQELVVAVTPIEILARYEAPFRARGIQPGFVTVSPLTALELVSSEGISAVAKLNGKVLTIMVVQQSYLKLIRTLELTATTLEDVATDLYPTFVYVEDKFGVPASRLSLCGFGELEQDAIEQFGRELAIPVEAMRSPMAALNDRNAGLLGYLQGLP